MTSVLAIDTRSLLRVSTRARPISRAAFAVLVGALVVGLLGMHALAGQGTSVTSAAGSITMLAAGRSTVMPGMTSRHGATMAAGPTHMTHDHTATRARSAPEADASALTDHGSGHGMASMVMLCVAMLAAAALTLLLVLVAAVLRPLLPAAFQPAVVRERAMQWVRGTGPPHEWQFSVIRC